MGFISDVQWNWIAKESALPADCGSTLAHLLGRIVLRCEEDPMTDRDRQIVTYHLQHNGSNFHEKSSQVRLLCKGSIILAEREQLRKTLKISDIRGIKHN